MGILALAALALLAACATYQPPPDGVPSASILFIDSTSVGGSQAYFYEKNDKCDGPVTTLGQRGMLWDNTDKPVRVAAEQRLYIYGDSSWVSGGTTVASPTSAYTMTNTVDCFVFGSFVPERDHVYELTTDRRRDGCHLAIKDKATGQAPPSFDEPAIKAANCNGGHAPSQPARPKP